MHSQMTLRCIPTAGFETAPFRSVGLGAGSPTARYRCFWRPAGSETAKAR
jgi:hypothetical protein